MEFDLKLLLGQRIDRYSIEEVLGEGAFGVTFKATDTKVGSSVAIKILKTATKSTPSLSAR